LQSRKSTANGKRLRNLRAALCDDVRAHAAYELPLAGSHETTASDLDYFVWLIRGAGRDILVDTGFNAAEAGLRNRKLTLNPVDALARFGVGADAIRDVVITICITTTPATSICFRTRVSSAGSRDELRHRALHVFRRLASSVFGRACDADGPSRLQRTRDLPFR